MSKIAEYLEVTDDMVRQTPALILEDSFFTKLAEYGIAPRDEAERIKLLKISDALEDRAQKVASAATSRSVLDYGLDLLGYAQKTASASRPAAELAAELEAEVQSKTAAYLNSPEIFAAGLTSVDIRRGGANVAK